MWVTHPNTGDLVRGCMMLTALIVLIWEAQNLWQNSSTNCLFATYFLDTTWKSDNIPHEYILVWIPVCLFSLNSDEMRSISSWSCFWAICVWRCFCEKEKLGQQSSSHSCHSVLYLIQALFTRPHHLANVYFSHAVVLPSPTFTRLHLFTLTYLYQFLYIYFLDYSYMHWPSSVW